MDMNGHQVRDKGANKTREWPALFSFAESKALSYGKLLDLNQKPLGTNIKTPKLVPNMV
ncbi:MAG: hypothetical protein Ct9H300mP18_07470 [Candidatus Neomarinimicrobiota bacterium]|nr:MAG: hypothetical protein Ct9H300mP18_07470 [Candidatus Neomarinimicrobiota bacterium]